MTIGEFLFENYFGHTVEKNRRRNKHYTWFITDDESKVNNVSNRKIYRVNKDNYWLRRCSNQRFCMRILVNDHMFYVVPYVSGTKLCDEIHYDLGIDYFTDEELSSEAKGLKVVK